MFLYVVIVFLFTINSKKNAIKFIKIIPLHDPSLDTLRKVILLVLEDNH